jgi:hypothetical protein
MEADPDPDDSTNESDDLPMNCQGSRVNALKSASKSLAKADKMPQEGSVVH